MDTAREDLREVRQSRGGAVRRRHVIYVEGYDPRGAEGYFDLFRRTCDRFQRLWPVSLTLRPLEIDSDHFAHWNLALRDTDWQVATHYDFVRMESFIRADIAGPMARHLLRAFEWCADDVLSGAQFRIFRASWRFALHLLYFQLLALAWPAAAIIAAFAVGEAAQRGLGWPMPAAIAPALLAGIAVLFALQPLGQRWRLVQIVSCWSTLRRFGCGRPTWIDDVVDVAAQRVITLARDHDVDELALIGHSTGGVIACAIAARALQLDPDLGRDGPRLVLLTLGSVMPAVALHPAAQRMRNIIGALAEARNLAWVDCQSRKDIMCFANFDPVAGIGVDASAQHCNPLLWRVTFKEMMELQDYDRFRRNHFRVHYQYIMAGDRPAAYDFIWVIAGPLRIAEWPKRQQELMDAFLENSLAMNVATTMS